MNNTFGQAISVTLFGESHGPAIGAVVDGLAPGLPVEPEAIRQALARRRPASNAETPRVERDAFEIVSGVFEGKTTGTPLCLIIPNENTRSGDYTYGVARPSHADYAAFCKYHGFEDYRGGGHFSGRITAALVAVGGLLLPALQKALEESHPQNTAESLLPLMGMGYGLTPGGDDFIGGLLAALHLAESPERDRPSGFLCALTERLLPEIPIRTGKVSHAYLAAACEGSFSENVALLLNSCGNAAADEHDIKQHAASLLSFGASSGADTLAGIVFALSICEKTSAFA